MPKMSDMSQILRDRIRPCSLEVDSGLPVRVQLRGSGRFGGLFASTLPGFSIAVRRKWVHLAALITVNSAGSSMLLMSSFLRYPAGPPLQGR